MLDTTKGPSWRLDLQRTGLSSAADVFFEPPGVKPLQSDAPEKNEDMFGKLITVAVTYSDGATGSGSCKATTPTDHKRKIGAAVTSIPTKGGAPPPRLRAVVHLASGDRISGEVAKWDDRGVTLAPEWGGEILLPTDSLAALRPLPAIALADKDFEDRRRAPLAEDVAFVKNREEKLDSVAGKVLGLADAKLRFLFQGQERSLAATRVLAVVFASRPKPRGVFDAYQSFELASGDLVTGKWLGLADGRQKIAATWNPKFNLPSESVRKVHFHNGKLVRLSDLAPSKVEEVGFFDRVWPYQRDQSLAGEPLKLKGAPLAKGIAVHSKSALAYDLGGQFARFKTTVGFDESVAPVGRVLCRIVGDEKELFRRDDLRADAEPVDIDLPVAGVKRLILEIDFGPDEDAGDRVIWADPRLFR
jgi:hypothetical protein